jgi:ribosomal protein S18 acetylase RimI-like enzyme
MSKPLTESVLTRLTMQGIATFLGNGENSECVALPGASLTLCHEPVTDLNYVVAGHGANQDDRFRALCRSALSHKLPFLAIVFPEAGEAADKIAEELGLVYAVDFPIMVREDSPIETAGSEGVEIRRAAGMAGAADCARVLAVAFNMPEESVLRALPPSLTESPAIDVYLAYEGDRAVGSVTLTHHGDTTGVWAMGTDTSLQKRGIGRRLLSSVMAEAQAEGTRRFFLGATPAGYRLYESLGFQTRCVTKVYAAGETSQG